MSGRPGAVPGAGAENIHPASEPKASLSSIGGAAPVPPPSLAFALAALRFPRAASGGFSRFMPFVRCGRQGPVAALPPRCAGPPLAPWLSSGRRAFAPTGAGAGGRGFGVPSRPCRPLPAGAAAAPGGAGGRVSWFAGFFGGVSWLLCLAVPASCRSFAWFFVPPGAGSRRGAVPPWACRFAVRVVRCPASWRWPGSVLSPPRRASRCRGVGGCRPAPAFAPCARWPVGLRFPCRFVPACRRAAPACGACRPLARLSRALPSPVPGRRSGGGRVFRFPPLAGGLSAPRGRGGGFRARRRPCGRRGVRRWRRCVRAFRRPRCGRVRGVRVRVWPRGVRRPLGGPGARRRRRWPRFRVRGVSWFALSRWAVALGVSRRLFLRAGFRLVGVCRVRRRSGRAGGGVSLRVFGAAALGRLAARRRCWGLGARVPAALSSAVASSPPFCGRFIL